MYGALVPAPTGQKAAKKAADFVAELCTYPGPRDTIQQARRHILALRGAAERLSRALESDGAETVENDP